MRYIRVRAHPPYCTEDQSSQPFDFCLAKKQPSFWSSPTSAAFIQTLVDLNCDCGFSRIACLEHVWICKTGILVDSGLSILSATGFVSFTCLVNGKNTIFADMRGACGLYFACHVKSSSFVMNGGNLRI
ncbi:hypothetical protein ACSBR2_038832 [Camellia fascicularis]